MKYMYSDQFNALTKDKVDSILRDMNEEFPIDVAQKCYQGKFILQQTLREMVTSQNATRFLSQTFGRVHFQPKGEGVECLLLGYFEHRLKNPSQDKHKLDGRLISLHALRGLGSTQEKSALSLSQKVLRIAAEDDTLIIKHIPKSGDIYVPKFAQEYRNVEAENPMHDHGNKRLMDFNVIQANEGFFFGSTDDELSLGMHLHLHPAT